MYKTKEGKNRGYARLRKITEENPKEIMTTKWVCKQGLQYSTRQRRTKAELRCELELAMENFRKEGPKEPTKSELELVNDDIDDGLPPW